MSVRVIYFDIGGVIVNDRFDTVAPLFSRKLHVPAEKLIDKYHLTNDWKYAAGKEGIVRWKRYFKMIGRGGVDVEEYVKLWHTSFQPLPGMLRLIEELSGDYVLGLLSDQPADIMPHLESLGFLDKFKLRVISCEVGLSKRQPDDAIYRLALRKAGTSPDKVLFIDNSPRNIYRASALGMRTMRFDDAKSLRASLVNCGII